MRGGEQVALAAVAAGRAGSAPWFVPAACARRPRLPSIAAAWRGLVDAGWTARPHWHPHTDARPPLLRWPLLRARSPPRVPAALCVLLAFLRLRGDRRATALCWCPTRATTTSRCGVRLCARTPKTRAHATDAGHAGKALTLNRVRACARVRRTSTLLRAPSASTSPFRTSRESALAFACACECCARDSCVRFSKPVPRWVRVRVPAPC